MKAETTPTLEAPATQPQRVVLLNKEHDITAFASSDPTRYVLQGVHYNEKAQCLEATNGRVLLRVPVETSEDFLPISGEHATATDAIIPVAPFLKALANIPKNAPVDVLANIALSNVNGEKVKLTTNDTENEQNLVAKRIEGTYPDCEQVIPTKEPTFSIALNAELLRRIGQYFARHGQGDEVAVTFQFTASTEAVRFAGQLASGKRATGVLMPMRLS